MGRGASPHRSQGRPDRRRRLAGAAAAAGLAAILASPGPPVQRPSELVIEADVQARLDVLATGLHREIVLCLLGEVRGGTARADEVFMPVPHASTATEVVTGPCPRGTVATWHNHPSTRRAEGPAAGRAGAAGLGSRRDRTDGTAGPAPEGPFSAGLAPEAPASEEPSTTDGWGTPGDRPSCRPSARDAATAVRLRLPFLVIADGVGNQCIHPLPRLEALAG